MTIILDHSVPETGLLELNISRRVDIRISAIQAKRKVSWWVSEYVSLKMDAEEPTLNICGEETWWKVPIIMTSSMVGHLGAIGEAMVDVVSGEIVHITKTEQLIASALEFSKDTPSFEPFDVPPEYLVA